MYRKSLILAATLLSCACSFGQSSGAVTDAGAPTMSFETKEHDYGTIPQDGNGTYYFRFTNTGKEPLVIKEARGSCGCTVPRWPQYPVPPGQSDTIKVTYDTHGHLGVFTKTVTINSNAKESPDVLVIKGNVLRKPTAPDFPSSNTDGGAPFINNNDN